MKKSYMVYFLVVAGISIWGILIVPGPLLIFWDLPSFIFTPLLAIIILLGHFSPREMFNAFRNAGSAEVNEPELRKSLLFFETFHRLTVISGLFAFMLGIVLIVYIHPSEEFNKNFGKFMAVCFLTVVYALFIIMTITVPFQSAIRKKLIR